MSIFSQKTKLNVPMQEAFVMESSICQMEHFSVEIRWLMSVTLDMNYKEILWPSVLQQGSSASSLQSVSLLVSIFAGLFCCEWKCTKTEKARNTQIFRGIINEFNLLNKGKLRPRWWNLQMQSINCKMGRYHRIVWTAQIGQFCKQCMLQAMFVCSNNSVISAHFAIYGLHLQISSPGSKFSLV